MIYHIQTYCTYGYWPEDLKHQSARPIIAACNWCGKVRIIQKRASWLGDRTETILMSMFDNVERMPINNPGYDFICGKGYKIDAKSSCIKKKKKEIHSDGWLFSINKNTTADYFLCLALDNRNDLNPLHVWLIPGEVLNGQFTVNISKSTLDKWSKYELSLDKVLSLL